MCLLYEGRSGVCSVSALKRVRLQGMSSWLAVRFSRDLGDLTVCLGDMSVWSGSDSSAQSFRCLNFSKGPV